MNKYKVAFLIDTLSFTENRHDPHCLKTASYAISLTVLRLLSEFAHRTNSSIENLRWGCQFFKATRLHQLYTRKSTFKKFSKQDFICFENQLEEEISNAASYKSVKRKIGKNFKKSQSVKNEGSSSSEQTQDHVEHEDDLAIEEATRGFSLHTALRDISHEFEWEEPDLSSPSKAKKSRSKMQERSGIGQTSSPDNFTKFVFVLMPCPKTQLELINFYNNQTLFSTSPNAKQVKELLVRETIKHPRSKLFDDLHASLFWIDTSSLWQTLKQEGDPTCEGYKVFNSALVLLNGCIIPINGLINSGGCYTTSLLPTRPKSDTNDKSDPLQGDSMVATSKGKGVSSPGQRSDVLSFGAVIKSCITRLSSASGGRDVLTNMDYPRVLLMHQKAGMWEPWSSLHLQPLHWNNKEHAEDVFMFFKRGEKKEKETFGIQTSTTIASSAKINKDDCRTVTTSANSSRCAEIYVRALVPQHESNFNAVGASHMYACIAFDPEGKKHQEGSQWLGEPLTSFEDVLLRLANNNLNLVLEWKSHGHSHGPHLAIMEPLTRTVSLLSIVQSDKMTLMLPVLSLSPLFDGQKESADDLSPTIMEASLQVSNFKKPELPQKDLSKQTPPSNSKKIQKILDFHKSLKSFSSSSLEPWYRSAPVKGVTAKFLQQLVNLSEEKIPGVAAVVEQAMSQLQALYKTQQDAKSSSEATSHVASGTVQDEKAVDELKDGEPKQQKERRKLERHFLSRTRSMVEMGKKNVSTKRKDVKSTKTNIKTQKEVIVPAAKDFADEGDLLKHVKTEYDKTIEMNSDLLGYTQQTIAVALHFMKEKFSEESHAECVRRMRTFLQANIIINNAQLVKKYSTSSDGKDERIQESKLQTLLRLEMGSVLPADIKVGQFRGLEILDGDLDKEKEEESEIPEDIHETAEEIAQMLSTIPILSDSDRLTTFLSDILVPNYGGVIPCLVKSVFDELSLPAPSQLFSPANSQVPSVKQPSSLQSFTSYNSADGGSGATSSWTRSLRRKSSLMDMGERRTIALPAKLNEKKDAKRHKKAQDSNPDALKAKRTLFSDREVTLSRRESIAVMHGIAHQRRNERPKRTPTKQRPHYTLKTKVVKETPGKRQVKKALLNKLKRRREFEERKSASVTPLNDVIEESPAKSGVASLPRSFPKPVTHKLSFYVADKEQKRGESLKKGRELSARIIGSSDSSFTSPTKKSKNLMKTSSSPAKFLLLEICTPQTLNSLKKINKEEDTKGNLGQSPELSENVCQLEMENAAADTPTEEVHSPVLFKTPSKIPLLSPAQKLRLSAKKPAPTQPALLLDNTHVSTASNLSFIPKASENKAINPTSFKKTEMFMGKRVPTRKNLSSQFGVSSLDLKDNKESSSATEGTMSVIAKSHVHMELEASSPDKSRENECTNIQSNSPFKIQKRQSFEGKLDEQHSRRTNQDFESEEIVQNRGTAMPCHEEHFVISNAGVDVDFTDSSSACEKSLSDSLKAVKKTFNLPDLIESLKSPCPKTRKRTLSQTSDNQNEETDSESVLFITPEKVSVSSKNRNKKNLNKLKEPKGTVSASPSAFSKWPRKKRRYNSPSPRTSRRIKTKAVGEILTISSKDDSHAFDTSSSVLTKSPQFIAKPKFKVAQLNDFETLSDCELDSEDNEIQFVRISRPDSDSSFSPSPKKRIKKISDAPQNPSNFKATFHSSDTEKKPLKSQFESPPRKILTRSSSTASPVEGSSSPVFSGTPSSTASSSEKKGKLFSSSPTFSSRWIIEEDKPQNSPLCMKFKRVPSAVKKKKDKGIKTTFMPHTLSSEAFPKSESTSAEGCSNIFEDENTNATSENDDVFLSLCTDADDEMDSNDMSTPPQQLKKNHLKTTPVTTKGLFQLMNSPLLNSGTSKDRVLRQPGLRGAKRKVHLHSHDA